MINYTLRGYALFAKMIFVILAARYFSASDIGSYGVFNGILSILVFSFGFEYYTYTQRELINKKLRLESVVLGHLVFVGAITLITLVAIYIFAMDKFPLAKEYLSFLIVISILELLSQDIGRALISLGKISESTFVFFIRSGIWPTVSIVLMLVSSETFELIDVYKIWVLVAIASILYGITQLDFSTNEAFKIELPKREWFQQGAKISFVYILSALFIKLAFSFDRILVSRSVNEDVLATYVLFIGMAMSVQSFIAATVFPFAFRDMVKSYTEENIKLFKLCIQKLFVKTVVLALIMVIIIYLAAPYILWWVGNDIYRSNIDYLNYTLLTAFSFTLATMSHQVIYSMRFDKEVMLVRLFLLFIGIVLSYSTKFLFKLFDVVQTISLIMSCLFFLYALINYFIYHIHVGKR